MGFLASQTSISVPVPVAVPGFRQISDLNHCVDNCTLISPPIQASFGFSGARALSQSSVFFDNVVWLGVQGPS